MSSSKRIRAAFADARAARGMIVACAALLAGCSADVTRFDFPAFGLTEKGGETGSLPTSSGPVARGDRGLDDGYGARPRGAGLGDARPYPGDRLANARDERIPPAGEPYRGADRAQPRVYDRPRAAKGDVIQVQEGDTLYSIARRYGVSISALIEVNGLAHGATIRPGQELNLPAGAGPARTVAEPPAARTPVAARAPDPPAAQPAAPAGWEGRHTLRPGESLYGIARQHGVSLAELQRVNGIAEPTRVRAGTVLAVPGSGEAQRVAERPAAAAPPRVLQNAQREPAPARIINAGEHKTAALADPASDAAPAQAAPAAGKFRWPARGRVISGFGPRPDGTHNDGINIALPQGTDVHAAEGGRVVYAGNELSGYGNLVLIRHDNGWVSAYAHADRILVKRDDVVRRGQVIAKAGKTGTVDQPQLHFELRQGSKPVDPLAHMER